jgi:hypothetical protein
VKRKLDKLAAEHELARMAQERALNDYISAMREVGSKNTTRNDGTIAVDDRHHGRKAASEGRKHSK